MSKKRTSGTLFKPRAQTWNSFVDAAKFARARMNDSGGRSGAESDPSTIRVKVNLDTPRYGLLWLLTDIPFDGVVQAARPGHPWLVDVAIAAAPITADEVGPAWISGKHPARITDWATLVAADFPLMAIAQLDSFEVRAWTGAGNIHVLGKLLDSPLVLADLRRAG